MQEKDLGDGVVQGREDYAGVCLQPVYCVEPSVLHVKPPLPHKTRKNTAKNWIRIAHAPKLSLFKDFLHNHGSAVFLFKQL